MRFISDMCDVYIQGFVWIKIEIRKLMQIQLNCDVLLVL